MAEDIAICNIDVKAVRKKTDRPGASMKVKLKCFTQIAVMRRNENFSKNWHI